MKSIRISAAAALIIATAIVGNVSAQDQPPQQGPWTWGPGMMGSGLMGPGMMGYGGLGPWMMGRGSWGPAMCSAMAGHIEGRLAYIKAELKITGAQEPLWNSYATAARDNANTMVAHCNSVMSEHGKSTASLPDRLDQHEQLMATQLDAIRAMNKALKPLYGALSDDQKKTADQFFWGPMGMM